MPATFSGRGSNDPDGDQLGFRWIVDGDVVGGLSDLQLPPRRHGVMVLELEVDDGRGGTDRASLVVAVGNVPPVVEATGPPRIAVGETWPLQIEADDPWSDRLDARVEWGDGTMSSTALGSPRALSASGQGDDARRPSLVRSALVGHAYTNPGSYLVTVTVCDDADACAQAEVVVDVDRASSGGGTDGEAPDSTPASVPPAPTPAVPPPTQATAPTSPGPSPLSPSIPATGSSTDRLLLVAVLITIIGLTLFVVHRLGLRPAATTVTYRRRRR